jgi:hypothetical protein
LTEWDNNSAPNFERFEKILVDLWKIENGWAVGGGMGVMGFASRGEGLRSSSK